MKKKKREENLGLVKHDSKTDRFAGGWWGWSLQIKVDGLKATPQASISKC